MSFAYKGALEQYRHARRAESDVSAITELHFFLPQNMFELNDNFQFALNFYFLLFSKACDYSIPISHIFFINQLTIVNNYCYCHDAK